MPIYVFTFRWLAHKSSVLYIIFPQSLDDVLRLQMTNSNASTPETKNLQNLQELQNKLMLLSGQAISGKTKTQSDKVDTFVKVLLL